MLPLSSLWLPIVVATALVFIASAIVWMAGPHHRNEMQQLPAEARANMARPMALTALWFLGINFLVGAIAAWTMGMMTAPREIIYVTGTAAFLAHGAGAGPAAIWWAKPWGRVTGHLMDAAIYGAITGATFMWLWPR
jgi:hypothetical protein